MTKNSLVASLVTTDNPFNTTDEVVDWIAWRNREGEVKVDEVPFSEPRGWHFESETGTV